MGMFNAELFIREIRARPGIWNAGSEEYKDRELKTQEWAEVCNIFYPEFKEANARKKSEICKSLQGKWKNIKDSYRKHWKLQKSHKSGQSNKQVKSYVYADQLSFLDGVVEVGPSEASPNFSTPQIEECKEEDKAISKCNESTMTRRKRAAEDKIEHEKDSYSSTKVRVQEEGDDINFFKSLLPIVQSLPMLHKMKFRMDVMKIAIDYAEKAGGESHVTPPHQM